MSKIYDALDPDDLDAMSTERWRITRTATQALGMDIGTIVMSNDDNDLTAPGVIMLTLAPGGMIGRHAHSCHRVEIIVRGSLSVSGGRVLKPGDVMITAPGEFYGPHFAGPDGCLSAEIFSRTSGFPTILDPDGAPEDVGAASSVNDAIEAARRYVPDGAL